MMSRKRMLSGKRILAGILTAVMVVSSAQLPMSAVYAEEITESVQEDENGGLKQESGEDSSSTDNTGTEDLDENEGTEVGDPSQKDETADGENPTDGETGEPSDEENLPEEDDAAGEDGSEESDAEDLYITGISDNDLVEPELQEIMVEAEIDGAYQFGDAPSKRGDLSVYSVSEQSDEAVEYLYEQMLARKERIDISSYNLNVAGIQSLVSGVLNEHPDLYFVERRYSYSPGSGESVIALFFTYSDAYDNAAFKQSVTTALSQVNNQMSDLEKAIVLHDYLTVNCEYDYQNYLDKSIPDESYNAYGILVNRIAVCQGYALAYKYLLNQEGIDCYMVTSDTMNHAWNMIVLDGKYYQVDVTWDDPTWDLIGRSRHAYMFCSDTVFQDANHNHKDWRVTSGSAVVDYQATDTRYDDAFWTDCSSPLVLSGDDCYYVSSTGSIKKTNLSLIENQGTEVVSIGKWPVWGGGGTWSGSYSGLFMIGDRLYYNDKSAIYSIAMDGTDKRTEFEADTTDGYIYGSAYCQGKVLYALHQSPIEDEKETVLTADITVEGDDPIDIPVESIELSADTLGLAEGEEAELTAAVNPANATDSTVTWTSDDETVAEVDNGIVRAVSAGSCTVTATAGDKKAECNVQVTAKKNSGALDLDNLLFKYHTVDDEWVASNAEGRPKLLIFYTCDNCRNTIRGISDKIDQFEGIDVYAIETSQRTKDEVIEFRQKYGCEEIIFCYNDDDDGNQKIMFEYVGMGGYEIEDTISEPVICYIDANDRLRYMTMSLIDADEILSNLKEYCSAAVDEGDYLTEDPRGYDLTDITMTPGSYSAELSAGSEKYIYDTYYFKVIYTAKPFLANNFFKGKSKITEEELSDSSFKMSEFKNFNSKWDNSSGRYNLSGTFMGDGSLTPDTTYCYRLAYYGYDSTEGQYCYYFLTLPDQFTTGGPVTESSISIRDVSVEETGYQWAKIVWTIDNPNKEAMSDMKLHYTDDEGTQSNDATPQKYQDENYNTVPNKYYATVYLDWARKANVTLTTYIGTGEEKIIASDEISITPKDINDATIDLTSKVGTGSLQALVELSPCYPVDGSIIFYLYYRKKSDTSWQSVYKYAYGSTGSTSASAMLQVSDLSENTEYEYYIKPGGRLGERTYEKLGTEDNPLTFTTKGSVTYEDTEFPDEVFRNYIKKQINIKESDQITSDKLEKLTSIDYDRSSASGNISSLQGIEHIENLTSITFPGHAITDVGGLDTLTALTNINLQNNDLTELPDLSGMSRLTYANFNANRIDADTITEAKLPASLLTRYPDWIADTKRSQRAEIESTLAPEYYVSGEARPFLIKVTGLKNDSRRYTLSLTIDGKTVSGTESYYSYYEVYYIKDILKDSAGIDTGITVTPGTPCQATITLTDNYGNEWLNRTDSITFAAADAITSVVKTQHIGPDASYVGVEIENLPAAYTEDSIEGLTLVDQEGTPVGSAPASRIYINTSNYNPYEDVFGYFYIYDLTNGSSTRLSATVYFAKYLSAGYYDAVVTATDGTSTTYEKVVCVDDAAVVDYLSSTSGYSNQYYDNYGDYLYVIISGANIDPTRVRPIFYEDKEDITECISGIVSGYYSEQAVYKLKKLKKDTYWNISDWKTFTYRIEADDGYTVIDNIRDKSITLYAPSEGRDFVTFEHYNYKKGVYEVKTDSAVTDGMKVSVSVCNNSSDKVLMGTAQGEITKSLLSLDFKNEQGESYAPPKDKEAYFIYTYTDAEGNERSFTHKNSSVQWYNYYSGSTTGSKTAYSDMVLYHKALLKELNLNVYIPSEKVQAGQPIDAQIYTRAGSAVDGGKVSLTGKSSNGYINYTGTWQDSDGLGEGIYQIRYSQNSIQLYSHNIYVYDDEKFYMSNQWMYKWSDSSGEGICLAFSSEQLAGNYIHDHKSKVDAKTALAHWNNGNYKLELFDRLGNPISGWKADHASWSGSSFYLYLKDVPEGYVGYYAKLTKSGNLGIRLSDGTVYYSTAYDASEEYGEWETISSRDVWFNDDSATNAYYGFGSYAYPVTVTITKPYDTDVIHTFTVSAATSGNYYYFTASDLKDIDPKEAYRITAVSVDGSSCSAIGYLAVRGTSTVVNATGVSLNKTTLNMQLNQTEKLTAAVKPDNATNKNVSWTSDKPSVATVGTDGTVTAVSVGTAKITATTHNGKTADCTVQVVNYTLSRTELTFDLSTWKPDQTVRLQVSNGTNDISSSVTWSSNDESVATVTKDGVVTPEGAGTAKILAEVKNGPTLECNVTVSRDTLTGVTLNESECTLYLDSNGQPVSQMPNTKQLKLYLTPSDITVDSIIWTSDQPTVASVAADADDPLAAEVTAKANGTAKITATVTTKSDTKTAECQISVQTVTTAEGLDIPSGLTALTNEQINLEDVELPAGWEWMYPDVSLKQFAGMQAKAFAARYNDPDDPNAVPYETELTVALSTVTGIAIGADSNSLRQGTDAELSVIWNMNGTQLDLSSYTDKVMWSSTKESVAAVQPTSGAATKLTARGAGKTTVKAQVTFKDGKTYKAQYNVTVVDGEVADIQITAVDNFKPDADQSSAYRGKLDSEPSKNNGIVHVTVTGADKLTVKNNNAKVITTGKVTAEEGGYSIPLTIKAAGMAKITLTANDKAKTQKDIFLYVTDVKPNISEDTVTINLWQTTGTAFILYPNEGYQVTSADLAGDDASKFTLTKADAAQAKYVIKAADGTVKGSYKLTLTGKVKSGTEEYDYKDVAFTVKVVDQAPKYKIKQSAKVNLFYKDWENSILEVTSDEVLDSMELTGCDFTVENLTGAWHLKATETGLTTNCNKKGTLKLSFAGYKEVRANFTVGVEKKAPACTLRNKSMTVYPAAGLDSAVLNPLVYQPDGNLYGDVVYTLDNDTAGAGFSLMHENPDQTGDFLIKYTGGTDKNVTYNKAYFTLTHDSWAGEVKVPFTIKVNKGKPAAKLAKTTLQLNTNAASMAYDTAATTVMWKDGAKFDPLGVSVSAADEKSRSIINTGVVFTFDRIGDQVIAKLNNTAVDKGSYKFKVNVKVTDTLTVSTPLTIKIVDVAMDKAIKVSTKGSIDVLNREGSFVTATPALKSLNGTIDDVRLTGRAAHLFRAECADNKVIIHAKSDAALITKYNYKVKLNLTIINAEGDTIRYTTPDINLKLKQGKPKVTIAPKNATLFSGSYESITRNISATLKGAENPVITNVELMNNSDAFTCEYTEGVITLRNTPNAIKGKSYSLQFRVTFNGQADNEKATTVKYTVKVK